MTDPQETPARPERHRSIRSKWRNGLIIMTLIFVVIALAAWLVAGAWLRRGAETAAGVYMVGPGDGYVVISAGSLNRLHVERALIVPQNIMWEPRIRDLIQYGADYSRGRLRLSIRQHNPKSNHPVAFHDSYTIAWEMLLAPSTIHPGDWNLIGGEFINEISPSPEEYFNFDFWVDLSTSSDLKEAIEQLLSPLGRSELQAGMFDPNHPPIRSYLHRIESPVIIDYFENRRRRRPTMETLELIDRVLQDQPDDPWLLLHKADVLAAIGRPEQAERLLDDWQASHAGKRLEFELLEFMMRITRQSIAYHRIKQVHPDLQEVMEMFSHDPTSTGVNPPMDTIQQWLGQLLSQNELFFDNHGLIPPDDERIYLSSPLPNFLQIQVTAKVQRILAVFDRMAGHDAAAMARLAGSYRLGQIMNQGESLISRLIGVAVRNIAATGMREYVLNACATSEAVEDAWKVLEHLDQTPLQETGENLVLGELKFLEARMSTTGVLMPNWEEARIRHDVSDARFQLLRMAAAAWHCLLRTDVFPQRVEDFTLFGGASLPEDDFNPGNPLKFRSWDDACIVYSHGPDTDDDAGLLEYDPTNGTLSNGDILSLIPRRRTYPYPDGPVVAESAEEVLRQFPNGLPVDVFNGLRGSSTAQWQSIGIGIVDAVSTYPVTLVSTGPDQDALGPNTEPDIIESQLELPSLPETLCALPGILILRSPGPDFERIAYDPTNGTVSNGDLYLELPSQ